MTTKARAPKKRARGRAYDCVCGGEKLRLTHERGVDARAERWGYLIGECGGGVALQFDGAKVVEFKTVDAKEIGRARSLPAPRQEPYEALLAGLIEAQRRRLSEIEAALRKRSADLVVAGVEIGGMLIEANKILGYRHFGLFLDRLKLDRERAFTAMKIAEAVRATPRFFGTFQKLGQEKTAILMRLPEGKRVEVLEEGVALNGGPATPVDRVTYRQLNAYVRSVVGKSTRGRKPKAKDDALTERFGLPIEIFDAFQGAMKNLKALEKFARAGWDDTHRPAVAKLWGNVNHLFHRLQDDLAMVDLLHGAS